MECLIAWIILKLYRKYLLPETHITYSHNTEWIVNYTNYNKSETRIFRGESEKIIRERFLSFRPNAIINEVVCLKNE